MPAAARYLPALLLLLISLASNDVLGSKETQTTPALLHVHRQVESDGPHEPEPNRLGVPGLTIGPNILSSLLNPPAQTTLSITTITSSAAPTLESNSAAIGSLISLLNTILGSLTTSLPNVGTAVVNSNAALPTDIASFVPLISALESVQPGGQQDTTTLAEGTLPPIVPVPGPTFSGQLPFLSPGLSLPFSLPVPTNVIPTPGVVSVLSAILPTAPVPTSDIPLLISEITPLIPLLSTELASVLPLLQSFQSMVSSELPVPIPELQSLTEVILSEMASLPLPASLTELLSSELASVPVSVPTSVLPILDIASILSAIIPSVPLPTASIPPLISEIAPLIPMLSTNIPSALPLLESLQSMLSSELSVFEPEVASLTAMLASEVSSIAQAGLSEATVLTSELPAIITLNLPSTTIQVSIPTSIVSELSGISLPTEIPLSQLAASLSNVAGPSNTALAGDVVGVIASALASMVSNTPVDSLVSQVMVAAGSASSEAVGVGCSRLTLVGDSVIAVSVPCSSVSPAAPFVGESSSMAPITTPCSAIASTIFPPASVSTVFVNLSGQPTSNSVFGTGSSSASTCTLRHGASNSLSPQAGGAGQMISVVSISTQTITVTSVELSIIATCLGGKPTSMLTCQSLPACPPCPTNLPCLPDDVGSSSGSNSGSERYSGSQSNSGSGSSFGLGNNSGVTSLPSPLNGAGSGPCPGQGYLCDDCVNGWFCPPPLTPALPAPCGYGWPCYHCSSGWFCIPSPTTAPESVTVNPPTQATSGNAPVGGAVVEITVTSTQSLTVFETAAAAETLHPATAGWQYGGCYKDDAARALKNDSITATVVGGMTTEICITFCETLGYRLAGTEAGYMCFCGDEVVDSWRIAESDCGIPCEGEPEFVCGGNLALSIWSITGRVPKAPGPEMSFTMPTLSPGQTEMAVFTGAVRQSLISVTSAVWEWPADEDDLNDDDIGIEEEVSTVAIATDVTLKNMQANPTAIDAEGMASSVRAIVSAAIVEVQMMAASEVARAKSMIDEAHTVVG
ncbi:hypothetical protein QBC32DRAFT_159629 [Pseudoneurospora amorphoporcata]|uniref:WSC domain-containing protein n=1 Tax=Pseudoneurospora amorphoporcata TaxID=241081 RepID=A0AAN6NTM3_9PEZI|nr:hypothetical protein QBC32DRAFT_159629 [Pseudoneurospora amorphoporcata]